jgi:hypothetical protein
MEPPRFREKTCFSPQSVALAQHAFEQIWAEVAPRFSAGRDAEVRNVLASALMAAVRVDNVETAPLRKAGLQALERMYPVEMHMNLSGRVHAAAKDIDPLDV